MAWTADTCSGNWKFILKLISFREMDCENISLISVCF